MGEGHTADRGVDGLTAEELQTSRRTWWDDQFTAFLLKSIPAGTRHLLDIGCGTGAAAHALLPAMATTRYLGIDIDDRRLRDARGLLAGTPYAERVLLARGHAGRLPCAGGSVDLALTSMTLQHVPDVLAVLAEVARVLAAGGRFVAIEPDNLSNEFYLDGPLEQVNASFRRLFVAQRLARRPADTAVGTAVPSMAERAGLSVIDCRPYALGRIERMSAASLLERARRVATIASAEPLLPDSSVLASCLAALDRAAAETRGRVGYGGQIVPVFITIAEKR